MKIFSTLSASSTILFSTMLGKDHYDEMQDAEIWIMRLFFLTFNFTFVLVLLSVLVALLSSYIDQVGANL